MYQAAHRQLRKVTGRRRGNRITKRANHPHCIWPLALQSFRITCLYLMLFILSQPTWRPRFQTDWLDKFQACLEAGFLPIWNFTMRPLSTCALRNSSALFWSPYQYLFLKRIFAPLCSLVCFRAELRLKNRLRKLWLITRDPALKGDVTPSRSRWPTSSTSGGMTSGMMRQKPLIH